MPEAEMRLGMEAVAVRATMRDGRRHPAQQRLIRHGRTQRVEQADYAAHGAGLLHNPRLSRATTAASGRFIRMPGRMPRFTER
jgi:hypothetical protein